MRTTLSLFLLGRNTRYTDVEITVKGITIPAKTHVDIPVYAFHHDEEYWHEPWKFVPERYSQIVIVITFYSPCCLRQETTKGSYRLRIKHPPAHLSTTLGGGSTLSLFVTERQAGKL